MSVLCQIQYENVILSLLGRHFLAALFQTSLQTGCLLYAKLPELVISYEKKHWSTI